MNSPIKIKVPDGPGQGSNFGGGVYIRENTVTKLRYEIIDFLYWDLYSASFGIKMLSIAYCGRGPYGELDNE